VSWGQTVSQSSIETLPPITSAPRWWRARARVFSGSSDFGGSGECGCESGESEVVRIDVVRLCTCEIDRVAATCTDACNSPGPDRCWVREHSRHAVGSLSYYVVRTSRTPDRDSLAPSASQARHLPHCLREESEGISPLVPPGEMGRGTRARGGAENSHQQTSVHLSADALRTTAGHVPDSSRPGSFPKSLSTPFPLWAGEMSRYETEEAIAQEQWADLTHPLAAFESEEPDCQLLDVPCNRLTTL